MFLSEQVGTSGRLWSQPDQKATAHGWYDFRSKKAN